MSKLKVKHICQNCGNIEYEKKSSWRKLFKILKVLVILCIIFFTLIGSITTYNFIVTKSWDNPDLLFSVGAIYSFVQEITANFERNSNIASLSNNLTESCPDDECKAKEIFNYLKTFRYEMGTDANNPEKILSEKSADCDEISYLFKLMTASQDIKSKLICTNTHCWNKLFLENKTIKIDITHKEWKVT